MSVWVGEATVKGGTGKVIAMVGDTIEELLGAARAAGVPDEQFSVNKGDASSRPHYVLSNDQRIAIVTQREVQAVGVGHVFL